MNYKISTVKNYKQFDIRWAALSYKILPACMRLNGCGATSLTDIIAAIDPKITVKAVRSWLLSHGYVSANQGTYHAGIPAAMKAYGFVDVKSHASMSDAFKCMSKNKRAGVILFRGGTRGGRCFTLGGHFCAIAEYKKINGKHYLYICDPGPRNNNGWICYETEMKGLVVNIWTGIVPVTNTSKLVLGSAGKKVRLLQMRLNKLGYKISIDGKFGPKTEAALKACKIKYKIGGKKKVCGKKTYNKIKALATKTRKTTGKIILDKAADVHEYMKKHGFKYSSSGNKYSWDAAKKKKTSNCATYVNYTLQLLGILPSTGYFYCSHGKIHFRGKLTMEDLKKVATITYPDKTPDKCDLKPGDVVGYWNAPHTMIYSKHTKKGAYYWYSYGKNDEKSDLPRQVGNYNDKRIAVIIRFK